MRAAGLRLAHVQVHAFAGGCEWAAAGVCREAGSGGVPGLQSRLLAGDTAVLHTLSGVSLMINCVWCVQGQELVSRLMPDALHPSAEGAERLLGCVTPWLKQLGLQGLP